MGFPGCCAPKASLPAVLSVVWTPRSSATAGIAAPTAPTRTSVVNVTVDGGKSETSEEGILEVHI